MADFRNSYVAPDQSGTSGGSFRNSFNPNDRSVAALRTSQELDQKETVDRFKKIDSLSYKDKITTVNNAFKQGLLTKKDQQKYISMIVDQSAPKPQGLTPIETVVQAIGDPIKNSIDTVGNAYASGINYVANQINGTNAKRQQEIIDNLRKIDQLKKAAVAPGPYSLDYRNKLNRQAQAATNIARTQQEFQAAQVADVNANNDPLKVGGAGATLVATVGLPGAAGLLNAASNAAGRVLPGVAGTIAKVGTQVAGGAIGGATSNAAYQLSETGRDTTGAQLRDSALIGGAIGAGTGLVLGGIANIFASKAASRITALKEAEKVRAIMPELTQDQLKSFTPQKIAVNGESATDTIPVATRMSEKEYTTKFNKLSKSYDIAAKRLETKKNTMSDSAFKTLSNAIDETHLKRLSELDDEWLSPFVQKSKSNKITTFSGGGSGFSTGNKDFAATFADSTNNSQLVKREINKQDVLDTRNPSHMAKLEKLIGKENLATMVERSGNGLPNHAEKGEQDLLISAANKLGFKHIALSETDNLTKFNGEDVISYADTGTNEYTTKGLLKTKNTTPKATGGAIRLEQEAIEKDLASGINDLSTYGSGSIKDESAKVVGEFAENPERIRRIALGQIRGDNPLHEEAAYAAVRNKAMQDGDAETIIELAKSKLQTKLSESAQRLSARGYSYESHDPVELLRNLRETRVKAISRRLKKTEVELIDSTKIQIIKAIKAPTKDVWADFVKGLEC
jgi:hypothetical protein